MSPNGYYVGSREAAEILGWSPSKVRREYHAERLAGKRGPQPERPSILIRCDGSGRPVDPAGRPVVAQSLRVRFDDVERRLKALESRTSGSSELERLRDAMLFQQSALESQRRAYDIQAKAAQELVETLEEQSKIISTLLVGDPGVLAPSDDS